MLEDDCLEKAPGNFWTGTAFIQITAGVGAPDRMSGSVGPFEGPFEGPSDFNGYG